MVSTNLNLSNKTRQKLLVANAEAKKANPTVHSVFRNVEKAWKNRLEPLDFNSEALHFEHIEWLEGTIQGETLTDAKGKTVPGRWKDLNVRRFTFKDLPADPTVCGSSKQVDGLVFDSIPGLIYLPNILEPASQRKLIKSCLRDALQSPNSTSLDPHYLLPPEGLWNVHQTSRRNKPCSDRTDTLIQPRRDPHANKPPIMHTKRELIALPPITTKNFAQERSQERQAATRIEPSFKAQSETAWKLLRKLRWVAIGNQYHWGTKTYIPGQSPQMPLTVKNECTRLVSGIPWLDIFPDRDDVETWIKDYTPEAGIVNFYQPKDTLMAHVDHSEADAVSPLVSISLGLPAVFLIGGKTREVKPIAIAVRSGDAIIMAGPCRRYFHGIPRVYEDELPSYFNPVLDEDKDWIEGGFYEYLKTTRINVNVRKMGVPLESDCSQPK